MGDRASLPDLGSGIPRLLPGTLVCLALISLDLHLANRFQLPLTGAATVQANSPNVQHMDQDAYRWVPPRLSLSVPLRPAPAAPLMTEDSSFLPPHLPCLYDRPPPASV